MTVTDALQAALAAEHRAVFGYALLGPRLTGSDRQRAAADAAAHAQLRDATEAAITAAGATPVGPQADYPQLAPVSDAAAALRLALRLEDDAAGAWRYVYSVAASAGASRSTIQEHLTSSAVRGARWRSRLDPRAPTEPFPGI